VWGVPTIDLERVPQPLLYAGYVYDREFHGPGEAAGWYWLSVRHYDPALGRFIQPDPSEQEGTRSYAYAGDDPLDATDPSGLLGICVGGWSIGDCSTNPSPESLQRGAQATIGAVTIVAGLALGAASVAGAPFTFGLSLSGEVAASALVATGIAITAAATSALLVGAGADLYYAAIVSAPGDGGGGSSGADPQAASNRANSGPVTFRPPPGASADEIAQCEAYVAGCNEALDQGALSADGRVSTTGALRQEASRSAAAERARAAGANEPYVGHAGHVPDTTWTGNPDPSSWLDLTPRVNSSLGGQSRGYDIGFQPTEFMLELPTGGAQGGGTAP